QAHRTRARLAAEVPPHSFYVTDRKLAAWTVVEVRDLHARDPTNEPTAASSTTAPAAGRGVSSAPPFPSRARGATMVNSLPPGPRMPSVLQTIGWWSRPTAFLERCRARYGKRFTIRLLGQSPFVVLSDPDEIKVLFQAPPDTLHPGEGAQILEPVVGPNSVILLEQDQHPTRSTLLLPAFSGEGMQRLSGLMAELAEREVASWPLDEPVWLHPRLQRVTLEIILRTVFGLERGAQLDSLRELLTEILALGDSPLSLLPPAQRLLAGRGPMVPFERTRAKADELSYALIDERRGDG